RAGHTVIGYARSGGDVASIEELVSKLPAPRTVWVMVPAGEATHTVITTLAELLEQGDLVVDGGNSRYTDDQVHGAYLAERGIGFLDCGVSGGVWGLTNGYALMVGGEAEKVERLRPVFDALKPAGEYGFV